MASHREGRRHWNFYLTWLLDHRNRFIWQLRSIVLELSATANHLRAKLLSRRCYVHRFQSGIVCLSDRHRAMRRQLRAKLQRRSVARVGHLHLSRTRSCLHPKSANLSEPWAMLFRLLRRRYLLRLRGQSLRRFRLHRSEQGQPELRKLRQRLRLSSSLFWWRLRLCAGPNPLRRSFRVLLSTLLCRNVCDLLKCHRRRWNADDVLRGW